MSAAEDTTLRMERFFKAPPERIFRAFTTPSELRALWTSADHPITDLKIDARPGGGWSLTMEGMGPKPAVSRATYTEFKPPHLLAWTVLWEADWAAGWKEMRVTLRFDAVPGGTKLSLVHEFFPDRATRDAHAGGWGGALDKLAKAVSASG